MCLKSLMGFTGRESGPSFWESVCRCEDQERGGRWRQFEFLSKAVSRNRIGDKGVLPVHVVLPPSYARSAFRYPVVYVFHAFGEDARGLLEAIRGPLDEAVGAGASPECLLVGVPGTNRLGGSFYVDSQATGGWEEMATRELVGEIERRFRVQPGRDGRAMAGHGMGGFAAWNLILGHADSFCGAWAASPGAFDGDGLAEAFPTWDFRTKTAYGAAFSPEGEPPPYAELPDFSDSDRDRAIRARWEAGYGGVEGRLSGYLARGSRLKGVRFDYDSGDPQGWVPKGTKHVAAAMKDAGLSVEVQGWPSDQGSTDGMIRQGLVPFLAHLFSQGSQSWEA